MFDPINVALVKILFLLLFEIIQTKNSRTIFFCAHFDRRYKQYYHQMQILISSLEVIAEGGAAKTYTSLALETNSCRFRCLRDAIDIQIT
ncbi:putative POX domain-containing protein [Helianthus anomalus]